MLLNVHSESRKIGGKFLTVCPTTHFHPVAVIVATMDIHNFLRVNHVVDEPFTKVMTDPTATKVELLNDYDEIVAE